MRRSNRPPALVRSHKKGASEAPPSMLLARSSGRFATTRAGCAAASTTRAANRIALGTDAEVHGAIVPTAVLAIWLATARSGCPVNLKLLSVRRARVLRQILAHDRTQKGARAHGAELEQPHLFARQSHLRRRVINHDAEFGMGVDK